MTAHGCLKPLNSNEV